MRRVTWTLVTLLALAGMLPAVANAKTKTNARRITWTRVGEVNGAGGLNAISCPNAHLCVVVGNGSVAYTTNPTGPKSSWHRLALDTTLDYAGEQNILTAVGCTASGACVTGDSSNNGWVSSAPQAGAWNAFAFPYKASVTVEAIGCSPLGNCTALNVDNHAMSTASLGASSSWSFVQLPGTSADVNSTVVGSVSCPSRTCALTNEGSAIYVTGDAGVSWIAVRVAHAADLSSVDCVTASYCIATAADSPQLHVWISRRPAVASAWKPISTFNSAANFVWSAACARVGLCFVGAGSPTAAIYSSSTPANPRSWQADRTPAIAVTNIVCPTAHECLAADQFGDLIRAKF